MSAARLSLAALLGALTAAPAGAQQAPLALVLRDAPAPIDPAEVRDALADALGAPVALVTGEDDAPSPRLEVTQIEAQLVLRYDSARGRLERTTPAPSDPGEWQVVVALLGASLVRDESEALLSGLAPPAPPPAPEAPRAPSSPRPRPERPHLEVGLDLFPGAGFSSVYGGRERRNFSLGVLGDLYGGLEGYAFGGLLTAGGDVVGVQQSVGVTAAESVDGAQLGVVNVAAREVAGAQIGFINVAGGPVRGLQLGLVNVAESAEAGIGILNFYARGRTQVEVTGDSAGSFRVAVKHGSGPWHTLYSLGVNPFYGETAFLAGIGCGGRATLHELVFLDVDVFTHYTFDTRVQIGVSFITGARVLVGLRPDPAFAVVLGLGLEVHNTSDPTTPLYAPVLGTVLDFDVRLWPTLVLGVQVF
ncbi:MAG: hypothetical protein KF729_37500 [Sandaracinaceae bacterium]|nr:hypothetical protein [Sandaracinaceae bacterium]